jgi:hypothetical protein
MFEQMGIIGPIGHLLLGAFRNDPRQEIMLKVFATFTYNTTHSKCTFGATQIPCTMTSQTPKL